jgi:hypothetical protein
MSAELFHQLQQGDSKLWLLHSEVTCQSASGEPLQLLGCVDVPVKIANFLWEFTFLVCTNIVSPLMLGTDFIIRTRMVMDLSEGCVSFKFAPQESFPLATVVLADFCLHIK